MRKIVAMVALALLCLLGSEDAGAETGSSAQSFHRRFGSLVVDGVVDGTRARVTVKLTLAGEFVGEAVLTPDSSGYRFATNVGRDSARGAMRLRLAAPPQISSVDAELVTSASTSATAPIGFTGSMYSWTAPEDLIYAEHVVNLTPDLEAVTTVRGASRTNVSVVLLAGTVPVYTLSVNQVSPTATISDSLALGDVRIASGATFILTIPTTEQLGQLVMQATFQSRNIPPTSYSAAIAVWH
ncbi:MAG TPA: hypothetical protein VHI13_01665 [Candidatus Kapabacteria bacterium]|nr:hypothetical protein [Candidatus Kapabacteria bacterium]